MIEHLNSHFEEALIVWSFSLAPASSDDAFSLASKYYYVSGTENEEK